MVDENNVIEISDEETFNLDMTIARFILPRLRRFQEITCKHKNNTDRKKWKEILDKIIYSFEETAKETPIWLREDDVSEKVREGLKLFAEYFNSLWW